MSTAAVLTVAKRGVSFASYRIGGDPVLHAIDSQGNLLRRVRLRADVDETIARAFLEGLLEHDDPLDPPLPPPPTLAPPLQLIRLDAGSCRRPRRRS